YLRPAGSRRPLCGGSALCLGTLPPPGGDGCRRQVVTFLRGERAVPFGSPSACKPPHVLRDGPRLGSSRHAASVTGTSARELALLAPLAYSLASVYAPGTV